MLGKRPLPDLRELRLGVALTNSSAVASRALRDACVEEINGIHPHLCPMLIYFIRPHIERAVNPVQFWIEIPYLCENTFLVRFAITLLFLARPCGVRTPIELMKIYRSGQELCEDPEWKDCLHYDFHRKCFPIPQIDKSLRIGTSVEEREEGRGGERAGR